MDFLRIFVNEHICSLTEMPWNCPSKPSNLVYVWAIEKVEIDVSENSSDVHRDPLYQTDFLILDIKY